MARKRDQVQIQVDVSTQAEWEEELGRPGLTVVDVYPAWCGPCTSMFGLLKKIKFEEGDDDLKFVSARSDSIDALEPFRGRCEPLWLFYGSGQPVLQMRGADAPRLARAILEQFHKEKKVMAGEAKRAVITLECDAPAVVDLPEVPGLDDEDETAESLNIKRLKSEIRAREALAPFSIVVFSASLADWRSEVQAALEERGFSVAAEVSKTLSEEEVDALLIPPRPEHSQPPTPETKPASAAEEKEEEKSKGEEAEGEAEAGAEEEATEEGGGGEAETEQPPDDDPEVIAKREATKEKLLEGECQLVALRDDQFAGESPHRWLTLYWGQPPDAPPDVQLTEPAPPPAPAAEPGAAAADEELEEPAGAGEQEPAASIGSQLQGLLEDAFSAFCTPSTVLGQWAALRAHFPALYRAPSTSSRVAETVAFVVFGGDVEAAEVALTDAGLRVLCSGSNSLKQDVAGQLLADSEDGAEDQLTALTAQPVLAAAVAGSGDVAAALRTMEPLYLSASAERAEADAKAVFSSWGEQISLPLLPPVATADPGPPAQTEQAPAAGAAPRPADAAQASPELAKAPAEPEAAAGESAEPLAGHEAPAEQAAAEEAPAREASVEETPVEEPPTEEAPTEDTPAEEAPADDASAEEAPGEEAPAEEAPAEEASAEEAPGEEAPAEETSVEEAPAEEASGKGTPVEETPAEEAPEKETSVEEAATEKVIEEEPPIEEIPAEKALLEEVPAEEAPEEDAAAAETMEEEAPIEEAPAEEVPAEKASTEAAEGEEAAEEPLADEAPLEDAAED